VATLGKRVPNARAALAVLYRRPVITAADLRAELAVSAPTAQALWVVNLQAALEAFQAVAEELAVKR
jgi:hypothetical protein